MNTLTLRAGKPARYLLLSALSFALTLGITAGLRECFGVPPEISFAVALAVVFLTNFAGMRWWVFRGTERPMILQFVGFGLSSLSFRGLEYCGYLLLYRIAGIPYLAAAVATIGISFVVKYAVYDSWLFSRRSV
jgi:putative flippase GtrA